MPFNVTEDLAQRLQQIAAAIALLGGGVNGGGVNNAVTTLHIATNHLRKQASELDLVLADLRVANAKYDHLAHHVDRLQKKHPKLPKYAGFPEAARQRARGR